MSLAVLLIHLEKKMSALDEELATALDCVCNIHDVLPFLENIFPVGEAGFARIPDDLLTFLKCQPEFRVLHPGDTPRLVQIAGDYGTVGGMMLYRSKWDLRYYVAMPKS